MAKIILNNKEYEINSAALAPAIASLKSHLSTVINGSGNTFEPITYDGVVQNHVYATSGDGGDIFVKVGESALSADDLLGATFIMNDGTTIVVTENNMTSTDYGVIIPGAAISVADVAEMSYVFDTTFTETGLYFIDHYPIYPVSLTFPGAPIITLDGVDYSVDPTKISDATADFVAHLGTIAGEGVKVTVGGVEYNVNSAKVAGAISGLEATFGNLSGGTTPEEERLEGDGAEYYTLAPTTLSFRSTAPLNELREVQINGATVDPANYTLEEGSTIVTFPIEYLKTLDNGKYEVAIVSENKTVSGNFSVTAPELNAYNFYYNQAYTGYMDYFGSHVVLFMRENNTLDIMVVAASATETVEYTVSDGVIIINSPSMGMLHCTTSADGMELYNAELGATLSLNIDLFVSDQDYIYKFNDQYGDDRCYSVLSVIDHTKSSYAPIKTGINGLPTKGIESHAFNYCTNLVSITIPSCIEWVRADAFWACSKLEEVIYERCNVVDHGAYTDCPLTRGVAKKHSYFKNGLVCDICGKCDHLHTEVVGKTDDYSGDVICKDCGETVTNGGYYIPAGVTYYYSREDKTLIEGELFPQHQLVLEGDIYNDGQCQYECISKVQQPANHKWSLIKANAEISGSYYIPEKIINIGDVTSIGGAAFRGCTSLTSIEIPDSVTSIGGAAFDGCTSLTSIEIPDSVTSIDSGAFSGCSNLIQEENDVAYVDNWVVYVNKLVVLAIIRETTTGICNHAFSNCDSLKSVTIPDSVTSIGYSAFADCTSLTSVTFEGTTAQWNIISKGENWKFDIPATHVHCSDGDVAL